MKTDTSSPAPADSPLAIAQEMAQQAMRAAETEIRSALDASRDAVQAALRAVARPDLDQVATRANEQVREALDGKVVSIDQAVQVAMQAQQQAVNAAQTQAQQAIAASMPAQPPSAPGP